MKKIIKQWLFLLLLTPQLLFAADKILNVYGWAGEIPDSIIQQFENETGIKVNFSTYENNEIMFAKLRVTKNSGYDVILPYSSFVDRMRRLNMLEPLDKSKLPNYKNINPIFKNQAFDPKSEYSVPFLWGITGIFVNTAYHDVKQIKKWNNLWRHEYRNQLMLLDDMRDVFAMSLISLHYSANDQNPVHIKAAFEKLQDLMKNVKVFSSDTITSIMIDEDATIGMAWNGDVFKAARENPNIVFIYPEEGFSMWVDNLSILKTAPHKDAAHMFLNFLMRPEIAEKVSLISGYPTANLAGQKRLPAMMRNNPIIYPPKEIMKHGEFATDISEASLALYEKYWEELKLSG